MQRKGWALRRRHNDNLMYKGTQGKVCSGFMPAYRVWQWKQNEVFRQVFEEQYEHTRTKYRRQWFEAFRSNADEYISKYNVTKAATLAEWEAEMHDQERQRIEKKHMADGRAALKAKHLDLLREYHERHFFHWYERASERLQYFSTMKFVEKENLDAHIEAELNKYIEDTPGKKFPLNFVGQMPMVEDADLQIAKVPFHLQTMHNEMFPKNQKPMYEATPMDRAEELSNISATIAEVSPDEDTAEAAEATATADDEYAARAMSDILEEQDTVSGETPLEEGKTETSDEQVAVARGAELSKPHIGWKERDWKQGGQSLGVKSSISSFNKAKKVKAMRKSNRTGKR